MMEESPSYLPWGPLVAVDWRRAPGLTGQTVAEIGLRPGSELPLAAQPQQSWSPPPVTANLRTVEPHRYQ